MKLAAVIACRNQSKRLYAKPLQRLGNQTILEHLVEAVRCISAVEEIVLAISEGTENAIYEEVAMRLGVRWVRGPQEDVLWRLIQGGRAAEATNVLRATSDNPFIYWEGGTALVEAVRAQDLDLAVHKDLPFGTYYEIIRLAALERSHREGEERHRSEQCSLYIYENQEQFRVAQIPVDPVLARRDVRLTVDWPEDLIVMRAVYDALSVAGGDPLRLGAILEWLDAHQDVRRLSSHFTNTRFW